MSFFFLSFATFFAAGLQQERQHSLRINVCVLVKEAGHSVVCDNNLWRKMMVCRYFLTFSASYLCVSYTRSLIRSVSQHRLHSVPKKQKKNKKVLDRKIKRLLKNEAHWAEYLQLPVDLQSFFLLAYKQRWEAESTRGETKATNNILPLGHNPTYIQRVGSKTRCWMAGDLLKLIEASETLNDCFSWCVVVCARSCT